MANTFGGLIIAGVNCEEQILNKKVKRTFPTAITGQHFPGGEVRLAIMQRILATVRPRPEVTIDPIPVSDDGALAAIITVREGMYPPYEYDAKSETCIPVRIQDSSRRANLRDIEALFEKRTRLERPPEQLLGELNTMAFWVKDQGTNHRATASLSLIASPRVPVRFRLDRDAERDFERLVKTAFFPVARGGVRDHLRTGTVFQLDIVNAGHDDPRHHMWALWRGAATGYTTNLPSSTAVGDIATGILCFLHLTELLQVSQNYFGTTVMRTEIDCPEVTFTSTFPATFDRDADYDTSPGIGFPEKSPYNSAKASSLDELNLTSTEHSACTADLLLTILRQTKGASIAFTPFADAIDRVANLLASHWRLPTSSRDA